MVPLSAAIISANKHDINAVTDVMDDAVIKRPANPALSVPSYLQQNKGRFICVLIEHIILKQ